VMSSCSRTPVVPGRLERRSTRIVFFIAGLGVSAWAPLVPFAKAHAGLGDGSLGLLLLCLGIGSISAMPAAGALAARFGCRLTLIISTGFICLTLPLLATISNLLVLVVVLFIFGASVGSLDCVVNIQAVIVERASKRPMMSGFHGLFSVGGIVGAGGVSVLLSMGTSPLVATLCVAAGVPGVLVKAAPHLLPYGSKGVGSVFAIPHGVVLFIGILCFILFLTQAAVLDWSAVFLTSTRGVVPSYAGLGYAAFTGTMTIGRLTGDATVRRIGGVHVVVIGSLIAAMGLAFATLVPTWEAGILGFALVGAGCSNIVPVLYSAVGRQKVVPEHVAVPAISTLGYAGILVGPAIIGLLAQVSSLAVALLAVAILLLGVAASGRLLQAQDQIGIIDSDWLKEYRN
jgi:predicted MFS family arabinose efflux permease